MKRILSVFFAAILIVCSLSVCGMTSFAAAAKSGDVDGNGIVNASDALFILDFSAGDGKLSSKQKKAADLNGDGEINSSDALFILEISVGIRIFENGIDICFSDYSLDPAWMNTVVENYKEFIGDTASGGKIPVIVSTDQHGSIKADSEVFRFINDLVDWNKISKIISLGDTVELLYWIPQLKAYGKATECLPTEKRLDLEGNHDAHISLIKKDMTKYFPAYGAEYAADNTAFSVADESFNVRYLTVNPMGYPWTYKSGKISTEQANFIVAELAKKDAGDIVLLAHPYLFSDAVVRRDGSTFTGSDTFIGNKSVRQSFLDMLKARKDKTAGVFTDSEGKEHPYDFSKCRGELLMSLHGHHHTEGYETQNGITQFMFQSMRHNGSVDDSEPNCFYFAYIDGANKKFKCWKNIEGYDAWEIDIA